MRSVRQRMQKKVANTLTRLTKASFLTAPHPPHAKSSPNSSSSAGTLSWTNAELSLLSAKRTPTSTPRSDFLSVSSSESQRSAC